MLQDLYTKRILSLREHCRLDAVVFADELQQDFSEGESIVKALALIIGNSQNQSAKGLGHVMEIVASRTDIPPLFFLTVSCSRRMAWLRLSILIRGAVHLGTISLLNPSASWQCSTACRRMLLP